VRARSYQAWRSLLFPADNAETSSDHNLKYVSLKRFLLRQLSQFLRKDKLLEYYNDLIALASNTEDCTPQHRDKKHDPLVCASSFS